MAFTKANWWQYRWLDSNPGLRRSHTGAMKSKHVTINNTSDCLMQPLDLWSALWIQHPRMAESANSVEFEEISLPMCTCVTQNHCQVHLYIPNTLIYYLLHPLAITKSDREILLFPENRCINRNLTCIKKLGSSSAFFLRYLKDFLKCYSYAEMKLRWDEVVLHI